MPKRNNLLKKGLGVMVKVSNSKKINSKTKKEIKEYKFILKNLAKFAAGIYKSHDHNHRYECLQKIRKLVSYADPPPPIQCVINTGIVPQLIYILHFNSRPKLQFEALWILTNIASGNTRQTRILVRYNVVPSLKRILLSNHTNKEIKSQAMWCIGNICGDSSFLRNILFVKYNIFHDIIIPICNSQKSTTNKHKMQIDIKDTKNMELMRETSWTICNFCRKASKKVFFENRKVIIKLFNFLLTCNDINMLADSCWAIGYFLQNRNDNRCKIIIDEMIEKGVILKMVNIILNINTNEKISHPTIRAIGNIIAVENNDSNEWTLKLIELGVLDKFNKILTTKNDRTNQTILAQKRETLWTLSNMVANGDRFDEILSALYDNQLFQPIMNIFKCSKWTIRTEAAWIIANIISNCNSIKRLECIDKSSLIIVFLFRLFRCRNNSNVCWKDTFGIMVLESIENILKLGRKCNNFTCLYNALRFQGLEILENMQQETKEKHKEKNIENRLLFLDKIGQVIKLLRDPQNDELLLVKCCNTKCNKTKYINGYETSSVASISGNESSSVSSESNYSRVKTNVKFYRCKKCNCAVYCSKRCQKWHWKHGHKFNCATLS